MRFDVGHVDDSKKQFELIPSGEYLSEILEVKMMYTKDKGLPMWNLKCRIADGDYEGRYFWDMWVFANDPKDTSQDLMRVRTKLNFKALGYDMSKPQDIEPDDLVGKKAMVTLKQSSYKKDGEKIEKNQVAFDGWKRLEGDVAVTATAEKGKTNSSSEPEVEDINPEDVPF
ncbi:MAG: DUF669 domain-containing protein [Candidatus Paceibacterota bacterium]|jgi:hypothetical protein